MNWFTAAGALLHILKNVPEMVDDVEDFIAKLSGKEPPPEPMQSALADAIAQARQG